MYLETKGAIIYYEVHGRLGPYVVLIHGAGDNSQAWYLQVPHFSQSYRVVTYDVRGHGKTRVRDGDYSGEACVEDLHDLMTSLSIPKAALLGYSMGGGIALQFTLKYPEMAQALILSNSAGVPREMTPEEQRQMEERRRGQIEAIEKHGLGPTFAERLTQVFSPDWPQRNPVGVESYKAIYLSNDPQEYVNRMRVGYARPQLDLSKITCPTFIIAGEHDMFAGPEGAKATQQLIRDSQVVVFPTGHATALEMPHEYNRTALGFLAKAFQGIARE